MITCPFRQVHHAMPFPARLLSLGTGLSLLLATAPVTAAPPDPGIDWGAEVEAAKARPRKAPVKPAAKPVKVAPRKPPAAPSIDPPNQPTESATESAAESGTESAAESAAESPLEPAESAAESPPPPPSPAPLDVPPEAPASAPDLAAPPPPAVLPPPPRPIAPRRSPARAELITGAVLGVGGLAALAVLANGLYVHRISERELARGGAYPPELLAPLERQHDQSETRIAAGAVAGVVGLALGAALIVAGARELRLSRRSHARLRVAPTFAGLHLSGRF